MGKRYVARRSRRVGAADRRRRAEFTSSTSLARRLRGKNQTARQSASRAAKLNGVGAKVAGPVMLIVRMSASYDFKILDK